MNISDSSTRFVSVRESCSAMHTLLLRYVAIHNEVFRFSWRRIIPIPVLFSPIHFDVHRDHLHSVSRDIEAIVVALPKSGGSDAGLVLALVDYGFRLGEAVRSLASICQRLHQKASGVPYSGDNYRLDVKSYERLVVEYRAAGELLNNAFRKPG